MIQRLRQLARSPRGRMILAGIAAALLGVLVLSRRKSQAAADGAPMTVGQVASDPRSSGITTADGGTMWADYGTTSPYSGGSIGGGGIGSGPDMATQDLYDWMADISDSIAGIQSPGTIADEPPATTSSPTAPAPVATTPGPAAPKPRFPGAKTWIDSKGNVRQVGTGQVVKPAPKPTQSKPKHPNAKTYYDAAGNVRQVGTGNLVTPAAQAPPRPTQPRPTVPPPAAPPKPPARPAPPVPAPAKHPNAKTFKHPDGTIRQVGTGKIVGRWRK